MLVRLLVGEREGILDGGEKEDCRKEGMTSPDPSGRARAGPDVADRNERPLPGRAQYNMDFTDPDNESDCVACAAPEAVQRAYEGYLDRAADEEWTYERLLRLDEAVRRNNGLPPRRYEAFTLLVWGTSAAAASADCFAPRSSARTECSICIEPFRPGQRVRQIPTCGHLFHDECVRPWFALDRRCPNCRCPADA